MLDIPTAQAKLPQVRANRQVRQQQPTAEAPMSGGDVPAGATSLAPGAPTAMSQTQPYEYGGQGWNDPVAQQVMKDYYADPKWNTGAGHPGMYEQNMNIAQAYNDTPGVLHSSLDPASWGTTYRGQEFADVTQKYKDLGGTYFNQFTPAQQAGVPYYAATGEAAPVMNMQTGVAETPVLGPTGATLGQTPTTVGGSGSYHSVAPDILNRMWR